MDKDEGFELGYILSDKVYVMSNCIFCKIINKTIHADIIYEDNDLIAFHDIHPKKRIHVLIIPKLHIESMLNLNQSHQMLMGKLLLTVNQLAINLGLNGYKTKINTGISGGQEVFHLHVHLLAN